MFKGWFLILGSGLLLFFYLRRQNSKIKASQEDFSNIFEQAPEGIFRSTLDGRYIKVNPAMARIYGYHSTDEMVSTITDIGEQVQVIARVQGLFTENLLRNGFVDKFEARNYRKDRAVIWTSTSARLVVDEDKNFSYVEGFVVEITTRKLQKRCYEKARFNIVVLWNILHLR